MSKQTKRAEAALGREHNKQLNIVYSACFCVLWQDYQWRENRIIKRFRTSTDVWMECGNFSILECMERETGIEMTLDGDKSFHEYAYFSADTTVKPLSDPEMIYMYNRVMRWLPTMILASVCLALYRNDGWGYERLNRFIGKVNGLLQILGNDDKAYDKYMQKTTGHSTREFWEKKKDD